MKILAALAAGILTLIGLVVVFVALDLGGMQYRKATSEMRGSSNAEVQIESAASRISNYEMFYDLCASVQKKEDAIDIVMANASMDAAKRDMAVTANQTQRANIINRYNAESRKQYTAARFKASDLPWNLDRAPYDGSNRTDCSG